MRGEGPRGGGFALDSRKIPKVDYSPAGGNVDHPELLGDECEVDRLDGKTFTLLALTIAISESTNLNISEEGRLQFWTRCQSNDPHTWFSLLSFLLK